MNNAKIAIVSLSIFGYFERMAEAATKRGIETEFFDERPSNGVWTKLILRLLPKRIGRKLVRRHIEVLRQRIVDGGFSHVLLVFAEVFSVADIEFLRAAGLHVSRYTWDSVKNRPDVVDLDPFLDRIGSFDPDDCAEFGYTYIPLYSELIRHEGMLEKKERQIDFYFCGTAHTDRASLIHQIEDIALRRGWRTSFRLFYHSKFLYAIRYWGNRRARALFGHISSTPVPHTKTLEDCRNAKVVIDIHHAAQSGLTMRSFEALAQGAVLLTTNRLALDLVDPGMRERIVYLDRDRLEASMEKGLESKAGSLEPEQYENLSLNRFIDQIFNLIGVKQSGGTMLETQESID